MNEDAYRLFKALEFEDWLNDQPLRSQVQILKCLSKIEEHGHFGDHKSVSFYEKGATKDAIWELRWQDGKRVYYAYFPENRILLLLGGNKNGQDQDVSQAKNIYLKTTKIVQKED